MDGKETEWSNGYGIPTTGDTHGMSEDNESALEVLKQESEEGGWRHLIPDKWYKQSCTESSSSFVLPRFTAARALTQTL